MGKCNFKGILTFLYSAIISVLLCLFLYIISLEFKINYKESFFLIGLVSVLIGIVVLISRNPIRMNGTEGKWKSSESEDEFSDEDCDEVVKPKAKVFLLGFNSFTIVLVGVLLLIIDAVLK